MRSVSVVLAALLFSAATPNQAGVTVNRAEEADFDRYTTFAWSASDSTSEPSPDSPEAEADELIRAAIRQELAKIGLREVSEDADLLVESRFVVREESRDDVDILDEANRWGPTAESAGESGEYEREIDMGTLTIDLLDGYSKLEVWRATATAVVRPQANKRSEKRINKVVGKMFEAYPVD
ncbi:MAG: DUF4136 domain-containing protein [Acidobacteriota bacterium]